MSGHLPPVPPAARTDKGPKSAKPGGDLKDQTKDVGDPNTTEQGRQGNIKQNTTHQGFQQDR
jgi:hypothetical protein